MGRNELGIQAEQWVKGFKFERLLNQDQAGRRLCLLGTINSKQGVLLAERAAFASDDAHLQTFAPSLENVTNLSANDVYSWFLASTPSVPNATATTETEESEGTSAAQPPDLKLTLIYPCTQKHIKKYSKQGIRMVIETPSIYQRHVRPYMEVQRSGGRLDWVYNIIEGRMEQEDIFYREHGDEGFLVMPDLNWDRKTIEALHMLAIVERRDIWSVRDLKKKHVVWLKHMRTKLVEPVVKLYPDIEEDQLKLYIHYQPTYYHFHIHIVHVMLESGATQSIGKALNLDNVISQLDTLSSSTQVQGEEAGMADVTISYHVGEQSELWTEIFQPLKEGRLS